jgi:hypothetical protein
VLEKIINYKGRLIMCKAKQYSEQLLNIYKSIEEDINTYDIELRKTEGYLQDIMHIIENENFNASEGYKLSKMIKDARIERRDLKNEIETLNILKKTYIQMSKKQLNKTSESIKEKDKQLGELKEKKIYVPRTLKTTNLKLVVSR